MTEQTKQDAVIAAWQEVALIDPSRVLPIGFDEEHGLFVLECLNTAWQTQMRLIAPSAIKKLNEALPEPIVRKLYLAIRQVRILVTGSRRWTDESAIADALLDAWHDASESITGNPRIVVVHGDCPTGADAMAKQWAIDNGFTQESHPADWETCTDLCPLVEHRKTGRHGEYCPMAGLHRNQHMVDLGADLVLAFHQDKSRGTADCIHRAEQAGIPVRRLEVRNG